MIVWRAVREELGLLRCWWGKKEDQIQDIFDGGVLVTR